MKKILLTLAACAAAYETPVRPNPDGQSRLLGERRFSAFRPAADISAIGSDLAGNLYYLNSGISGAATQLIKRTAAKNYSDPTALFSYSGPVYGDFVKVNGSTVYFGESTTNTIRSVSVIGTRPHLIATIPRNYDFAFNGNEALVDAADSNFANNTVFKLDLLTGATGCRAADRRRFRPARADSRWDLYLWRLHVYRSRRNIFIYAQTGVRCVEWFAFGSFAADAHFQRWRQSVSRLARRTHFIPGGLLRLSHKLFESLRPGESSLPRISVRSTLGMMGISSEASPSWETGLRLKCLPNSAL